MQGYEQTCSGSSTMTLVVGILVCTAWLVLCLNDIGGKDCMLILNSTANSACFDRECRLQLLYHRDRFNLFQYLSIHLIP